MHRYSTLPAFFTRVKLGTSMTKNTYYLHEKYLMVTPESARVKKSDVFLSYLLYMMHLVLWYRHNHFAFFIDMLYMKTEFL